MAIYKELLLLNTLYNSLFMYQNCMWSKPIGSVWKLILNEGKNEHYFGEAFLARSQNIIVLLNEHYFGKAFLGRSQNIIVLLELYVYL